MLLRSKWFERLVLVCCVIELSAAACVAAAEGPVKVFILSGQSNMEGKAAAGTLEPVIADPKTREQFKHLKKDGKWAVRDDVWVTFLCKGGETAVDPSLYGPLTIGFGGQKQGKDENGKRITVPTIGPELGVGYVLGNHFDEQVLLIKVAWGGRAVKYSFRPPSAMPTDEQVKAEVAAIKKRKPDAEVTFESHKAGFGSDYRNILAETEKVLGNIKKYFGDYDESRGYEISGFIWFQGWNDGVGSGNPDYTEQFAHLVRDLRKDLKAPGMPVVIGEMGVDGDEPMGWIEVFRKQQAAVAAMPEFKNNVRLAKTAHLWPTYPNLDDEWQEFRAKAQAREKLAKEQGRKLTDAGEFYQTEWVQRYKKELSYTSDKRYHYKGSGQCYYLMGEAFGKAMLEMVK